LHIRYKSRLTDSQFRLSIFLENKREMKKNDLMLEISKRSGLPKVECEKIIDTFAEVVTDALVDGDKVIIRGFLTFETSECKAREGFNPKTGKTQYFSAVKTVKCKVGQPIKDAVNER